MYGEYLTSHLIARFGERYHDFILDDGLYKSWPNDKSGILFDDGKGGHNLMGLHPFGLHKKKYNKFLDILFNNINAQDTYINTISDDNVLLEHRTIGDVIDYYLYYGEDLNKVIIKLQDILLCLLFGHSVFINIVMDIIILEKYKKFIIIILQEIFLFILFGLIFIFLF